MKNFKQTYPLEEGIESESEPLLKIKNLNFFNIKFYYKILIIFLHWILDIFTVRNFCPKSVILYFRHFSLLLSY